MAEASETHSVTGTNVAVGHNNTMNITYNNPPIIPNNLPHGTQVNVDIRYTYTIGEGAGAAGSAAEEEQIIPQRPSQQQHHHVQEQRSQQRPSRSARQDAAQHQQQQQQHLQHPQQSQDHLQHPQQPQHQLQQPQQQHIHQTGPQQQRHSPLDTARQTSGQPLNYPQQETSSGQWLPQQRSTSQRSRLTESGQSQTTSGPQLSTQASYNVETGSDLPYSLDPICNYPAMPLQNQTMDGRHSTPVQETAESNAEHRPPLQRASTDPTYEETTRKTPVTMSRSLPVNSDSDQTSLYPLDPDKCPKVPDTHALVKQLRVLPKLTSTPSQLVTIDTNHKQDRVCPDMVDICVITISSKPVLVVSDMANSRLKSLKGLSSKPPTMTTLTLPTPPISLSPFKGEKILVGYIQQKQFSIISVNEMAILETFQTKRLYSGLTALDDTRLAACCHEFRSIDILSNNGVLLRSYKSPHFKSPCFIFSASSIFVTDWMSKTLSCISQEGEGQFIASPSDSCKTTTLRGVAVSGNSIFVADETNNRILNFDASGKSVRVLLDSKDGINKPSGLCSLGDTLYISQNDGLVLLWKESAVTKTRL